MDVSKHISVFDPSKFQGKILIAGVGAIGSALALNLAKLGLYNKLVLMDDDKVEPHNIANQVLYGTQYIDWSKVHAADYAIADLTGYRLTNTPICAKLHSKAQLTGRGITHMFFCVDTMEARKQLFKDCVFMNPQIEYFADGRMAARHGMVYGFDPRNLPKSKEYLARWYPDEDVPPEAGSCGATISVGATAMFVAAQMTWQFINHFNVAGRTVFAKGERVHPYEEIAFQVDELEVHTRGYL